MALMETSKTAAGSPLLILGMHRSGTSFLASLLQRMGVDIGQNLLEGNEGNPRGHFEDKDVLDFHLRALERNREDVPRFFDTGIYRRTPLVFEPTEQEQLEAQSLIEARERQGFWGWKEPRTCLFVDFWMDLLPSARGLVIYRHPLEVFVSFVKRRDWEAVSDPSLVFKTYAIYNEALLQRIDHEPDRFAIISDAAFSNLDRLEEVIRNFLSMKQRSPGDKGFHAEEYTRLPISRTLHNLFAKLYPDAFAAFEALQEKSRIKRPFEEHDAAGKEDLLQAVAKWVEAHPDGKAEGLHPMLEALIPGLPDEFFHKARKEIFEGIRKSLMKARESLIELEEQRDTYIEKFDQYYNSYHSLYWSYEGGRRWSHNTLLPKIRRLEMWLSQNGIDHETGLPKDERAPNEA